MRTVDPVAVARDRDDERVERISLWIGGGAAVVTLLALGAMLVRRWGRQQNWRAVRAEPIVVVVDDDPDEAPTRLFDITP